MTEAEWQGKVVDAARWGAWRVAHFRPGLTADGGHRTHVAYDAAGFPDLVLVHDRRRMVLFRELKTATGRVTAAQKAWHEALELAGANVAVWRPKDWPTVAFELGLTRGTP